MPAYKVIDADGHVEPAPVCDWTRYVRAPYGAMADKLAKAAFDRSGDLTTTRRGGLDAKARLEDMDTEGIDVSVLFGGSMGLSTGMAGEDRAFGKALAEGYNNWLHDFCAENPDRLKSAALIDPDDIDAACREARRAVSELGAVGIVMRPFHKNLTVDDPYFFPLYEECEKLGAPLLVHGPGEFRKYLQERYHTHFRRHSLDFPVSIMMATQDMICGGVFEKFKKLRVALLEGSAGWVPWFLHRLDEHFEKLPHHVPHISEEPSDLARRYIKEGRLYWSCEPDEKYLPFILNEVGDGSIIYASDYPHWDAIYPNSVKAIAERDEISPKSRRKILNENAIKLFGGHI